MSMISDTQEQLARVNKLFELGGMRAVLQAARWFEERSLYLLFAPSKGFYLHPITWLRLNDWSEVSVRAAAINELLRQARAITARKAKRDILQAIDEQANWLRLHTYGVYYDVASQQYCYPNHKGEHTREHAS